MVDEPVPLRAAAAAALGRQASGAVVSQFLSAGTSFLLQVLAARTLGAAGYGTFTLLLGVLVTLTAIQSGWVGDSLTVLNRFDHRVRGALIGSQLCFGAIAIVVALATAVVLDLTEDGVVLLFGVMTPLWLMEEAGRRLLMARREFWKVALNDAVYALCSLLALAVIRLLLGRTTLAVFLAAMALGAASAIVVARLQLPSKEFGTAPLTRDGLREVTRFALWRSSNAAIRPISILGMRMLVAAFASRATLGQLEGARLLLAPAITLVNAAGYFLLPMYSDRERGTRLPLVSAGWATTFLVVATCCYGLLFLVIAEPISQLLTGGSFRVDPLAVAGWTLFASVYAAGAPLESAAAARRRSRSIFLIRAFESILGLALVVAVLVLGLPSLAPFALGAGMFAGVAMLFRLNYQRTGPLLGPRA